MFSIGTSYPLTGEDLHSTLSSASAPLPIPAGNVPGGDISLHSAQGNTLQAVAGDEADLNFALKAGPLSPDDPVSRIVFPLLEGRRARHGMNEPLTVPFDVTNAKQLALEVESCKRVISHLQSITTRLEDMLGKVEAEKEWVKRALSNDDACTMIQIERAVGRLEPTDIDIQSTYDAFDTQ